jgi:hypothetical protein
MGRRIIQNKYSFNEYFQIADETTLKPCLTEKLPKNTVFYSGYRQ